MTINEKDFIDKYCFAKLKYANTYSIDDAVPETVAKGFQFYCTCSYGYNKQTHDFTDKQKLLKHVSKIVNTLNIITDELVPEIVASVREMNENMQDPIPMVWLKMKVKNKIYSDNEEYVRFLIGQIADFTNSMYSIDTIVPKPRDSRYVVFEGMRE